MKFTGFTSAAFWGALLTLGTYLGIVSLDGMGVVELSDAIVDAINNVGGVVTMVLIALGLQSGSDREE